MDPGESSSGRLAISKGACTVMFAFDVGYAIDLDAAERAMSRLSAGDAQRELLRHGRKSPGWFQYRPAPLRIARRGISLSVAGFQSLASVDCVLYDFGAISLAYTFPLSCDLARLIPLSQALYENAELLADARAHALALLAAIGQAVTKPALVDLSEDYVVFHVESCDRPDSPGASLDRWLEDSRSILAHILRSEQSRLSRQEIDDATSTRVSYQVCDAAIIDWNAALLFGAEMEDTRAVLEFANVELLEMRFLDGHLDAALERAYSAAARAPSNSLSRQGAQSLREIAELQISNALLFENVNNTLKLLGDQYLARLYRAALTRLHLPDWDASILRKLGTLESIYDKLNDRQTTRRMETLEWIIIVLIAFEIAANWLWPLLLRLLPH